MENVNKKLAQRLRELRGERSFVDIEAHTGISRGNLTRYERGLFLPQKKTLKILATFFSVPYSELRALYYEDLFSDDPEELEIVVHWASTKKKG